MPEDGLSVFLSFVLSLELALSCDHVLRCLCRCFAAGAAWIGFEWLTYSVWSRCLLLVHGMLDPAWSLNSSVLFSRAYGLSLAGVMVSSVQASWSQPGDTERIIVPELVQVACLDLFRILRRIRTESERTVSGWRLKVRSISLSSLFFRAGWTRNSRGPHSTPHENS